jgi:hypothetical protein
LVFFAVFAPGEITRPPSFLMRNSNLFAFSIPEQKNSKSLKGAELFGLTLSNNGATSLL